MPIDAVIIKGSTILDTSSLTGEAAPINVSKDSTVLSGSINLGDVINVKTITTYESSTVAKILDLVLNASEVKSVKENLVSKISKVYTPIIIILAILVFITLPLFGIDINTSIYRALSFLVISCPCAIAISVPLSYFTGIGVSSSHGILIKGSNFLDNLGNINTIVFDKTGTITNGTFKIKDIKIMDNNYSKNQIVEIICKGESLSNHPIAKSIVSSYKSFKTDDVKNYREITGKGISFDLQDMSVVIGTKLMEKCQYDIGLHVHINGKHVATILIDDGIKDEAKDTINELNKMNVKTYLFTGDKKENALNVASLVGIENVKYEMLPQDKYDELKKLKKNNIVSFVGDGINDAPVLKLADIGISMGELGSSIAIESSDIVIMSDNLKKIIEGIHISKFTNNIIKENLIFAIGTKILILLLSLFGLTTMWFAIFADTGVTLLAILNTLRITKL